MLPLPWSKLPRALRGDWRITQRTPLALAAFFLAWLAADDFGVIASVGAVSAREALVAHVATLPGASRDAAWEAVGDCIGAGLLLESEDGMALHVADWIHDAPEGRAGTRPSPGSQLPDAAAHRRPGRPAKGAAPMNARERRVRSAFANREFVAFRDVAPGTTFEAWCAAHPEEAARLLRVANETPEHNPGAPNETPSNRTKLPNETPERNSVEGRADSETSGSSEASEDQNRARKERTSDAGAPRTKLPNETHERNSRGPNETPAVRTKLGTVETLHGFDAAELLDRMRAESGDRLTLMLPTSSHGQQFVAFTESIVQGGGSTDSLLRAARHTMHLAPDSWLARQGKLGLHRLMAQGGKILLDLLAESETCAACGGAALSPSAPRIPKRPAHLAVDEPALPPAAASAAIARLRGGASPTRNPTPAATAAEGTTRNG